MMAKTVETMEEVTTVEEEIRPNKNLNVAFLASVPSISIGHLRCSHIYAGP